MDIFICYRRDGAESFAQLLYTRLTNVGYSVFLDVESLRSGLFDEALYQQIDECKDFLLLLSPHGLDGCADPGDWVRLEIEQAIKKKKNIIPIMMRNFEFPSNLPASLSRLKFFNGIAAQMEYFDAVLKRIEEMLSSHSDKNASIEERADREYYDIKKPLLNHYRCRMGGDVAVLWEKVAAKSAERLRTRQKMHWDQQTPPSRLSGTNAIPNRSTYLQLKNMIVVLRSYVDNNNEEDLYFFNNALLYWVGIYKSEIEKTGISGFSSREMMDLICYMLDIPTEFFLLVCDYFDKYNGTRLCFKYFPIAFDVWPTVIKKSSDSDTFSRFAIVLFDFFLESNIWVNKLLDMTDSILSDPFYIEKSDLHKKNNERILSYYSYLTKKKVFLPQKIQKKVYIWI